MYILRDENNEIISYSKNPKFIEDAKLMMNKPSGIIETTDEKIICNDNRICLESEWIEYTKSEEYKYKEAKKEALSQIDTLKETLKEDDYKIIKIMEAKLKNEDSPYDIQDILYKRDSIRARINELEHLFL